MNVLLLYLTVTTTIIMNHVVILLPHSELPTIIARNFWKMLRLAICSYFKPKLQAMLGSCKKITNKILNIGKLSVLTIINEPAIKSFLSNFTLNDKGHLLHDFPILMKHKLCDFYHSSSR